MTKPQPITEVGIATINPGTLFISVDATPDAASDLSEFGRLEKADSLGPNRYHLFVDARYNFDEVVAYIKNYGKE